MSQLEFRFLATVMAVVFAAALALFSFVIAIGAINADGTVQHCYVEVTPDARYPYTLYGYRPWRSNIKIGVMPTLNEAFAYSDALSCPLTISGKQ